MFGTIALALFPTASLIAFGCALRRSGFLAEGFWPGAERLAYFVLLPALFVHSLVTADLAGVPILRVGIALALPILAVGLGLVLLRPRLGLDGPAFTSLFQGGIRFNNYVGVTLAAGLLGPLGVALAALANAVIVPIVNVLCVLVFARYGRSRATAGGAVLAIATNPLVLACALGGLMRFLGWGLPALIEPMIRALGQASLPIGLLCVGAAFDPLAIRAHARASALASVAKFVALPAATVVACVALAVDGKPGLVVLLFQALPTASSSYILARQLGGDADLMAGIVAMQTVLAALAMPLILALGTPVIGA